MKHKVIYSILIVILLCSGIFNFYQYKQPKKVEVVSPSVTETINKEKEKGLRNMFLQYVEETITILNETAPVLPILTYATNDEKGIMSHVDTKLLKENQVLLSLKPLGKGEDDSFIIEAMIYEKPDASYITDLNHEWPRQIGKDYITYGQFIMSQKSGKWEMIKFIDKSSLYEYENWRII